ncbi:type VII secretion-associated protein [Mycobacterium sp. Marseille-P9652]|uniref:type VII secretion-associated protein n=1 Tax=Mycobacterium sp. Marseille-P9652 TaxID=2654950 RepID=UPI0012E791DA|nr:type VII secretion-associated protein [Mycobacterium sp. Marseille-P9652]
MTAHRAVLEAGPGTIRRLCCGTTGSANEEAVGAALDGIDDRVALVGGRPVGVGSLWRAALRSASCAPSTGVVVVHPSWWPPSRVVTVTAAAATLADDVAARPRSELLKRASNGEPGVTVVVEIAERLVVVAGPEVIAIPRRGAPDLVAEEVGRAVGAMPGTSVVIDAACGVAGAPELAASIARAARGAGRTVAVVDDARWAALARSAFPEPPEPAAPARSRVPRHAALAACAMFLTAGPLGVYAVIPSAPRDVAAVDAVETAPTTVLVEGRVALSVPRDWPTQRVVAGPGSARVQVTSPSDAEAALHLTQSPVGEETLSETAERLKRAIDAEAAGVFVDFNPTETTAGRPAVTYRELRAHHHVRWSVFVDGPVRISVGCQSRPGNEDAIREACERAVRSARAIG